MKIKIESIDNFIQHAGKYHLSFPESQKGQTKICPNLEKRTGTGIDNLSLLFPLQKTQNKV